MLSDARMLCNEFLNGVRHVIEQLSRVSTCYCPDTRIARLLGRLSKSASRFSVYDILRSF